MQLLAPSMNHADESAPFISVVEIEVHSDVSVVHQPRSVTIPKLNTINNEEIPLRNRLTKRRSALELPSPVKQSSNSPVQEIFNPYYVYPNQLQDTKKNTPVRIYHLSSHIPYGRP